MLLRVGNDSIAKKTTNAFSAMLLRVENDSIAEKTPNAGYADLDARPERKRDG